MITPPLKCVTCFGSQREVGVTHVCQSPLALVANANRLPSGAKLGSLARLIAMYCWSE